MALPRLAAFVRCTSSRSIEHCLGRRRPSPGSTFPRAGARAALPSTAGIVPSLFFRNQDLVWQGVVGVSGGRKPGLLPAAKRAEGAVRRNAVVHGGRGESPLLAAAGGSGGTPKNVGSESDIGLDPALGDGEGDPRRDRPA